MEAFRQRVIDEKAELDGKLKELNDFLGGERFNGLPPEEQSRLLRQAAAMSDYSTVLGERIAAFRA